MKTKNMACQELQGSFLSSRQKYTHQIIEYSCSDCITNKLFSILKLKKKQNKTKQNYKFRHK